LQSHKDELDRLRRELDFANERAEDLSRSKNTEVSSVLSRYNRQIQELEDSLRSKQIQIDDLLARIDEARGEADRVRDEKEQEIQILQEEVNSTLQQMAEMHQTQGISEQATNAQIDTLILDNRKKLNTIIGELFVGFGD
jgi:huntingtin-interacting protein 1-related protein